MGTCEMVRLAAAHLLPYAARSTKKTFEGAIERWLKWAGQREDRAAQGEAPGRVSGMVGSQRVGGERGEDNHAFTQGVQGGAG